MKRITGVAILLGILFVGCEKSVDAVSVPDQTNGRITIINDEARLAERMTLKNETVPVETTLAKASATAAFGLTYIAEIAPPTVAGQKLQATSVVLNANFAYVSYNMAGSSAIGAVDVIQVKGVKNPVIRSEVTFTDADVNNVCFDNNNVYLAEASGNLAYDSPAFVERISCNGGKLDIADNFKRMLNSYAATSVYASSGKIYVTTGSTGGLHVLTQSDTLPVVASYPLTDARWVDMDNTYVVVAQGTPGRLSVYNRSTMALLNTFSVPGATIAESKSTVRVIGGKALFAAGDGGVQLVNLATGTVVGSIPRVTVSGLSPAVTVTNAVDASGAYLFSSNGEAGIFVALASQSLSNVTGNTSIPLLTLGKLQFASLQSVNHVAFDGSTLAIAAGLGGTKLVDFSQ